eukprot:1519304-Prymnesium_polylepis.2
MGESGPAPFCRVIVDSYGHECRGSPQSRLLRRAVAAPFCTPAPVPFSRTMADKDMGVGQVDAPAPLVTMPHWS